MHSTENNNPQEPPLPSIPDVLKAAVVPEAAPEESKAPESLAADEDDDSLLFKPAAEI